MIILTKLDGKRIAIGVKLIIDIQECQDYCRIYFGSGHNVNIRENFDIIVGKINDSRNQ